MIVDTYNQWAANVISFVDDDNLYLRLAAEGSLVWYIADEVGQFVWVLDTNALNAAWANRGV